MSGVAAAQGAEAGRAEAERAAFLRDALAGLSAEPRTLPGKYLWDAIGSDLFDRICHTADYYPTRREMALLPEVARDVAGEIGPGARLVEFGSGASRKIRTLLDALSRPATYIAVDISGDYLAGAIRRLAPDYPAVTMQAVCADYAEPFTLPLPGGGGPVLGFFPGTSIGNFPPAEAGAFLARARAALGPCLFLVGADPTVDPDLLHAAYGGADGLMDAFHRNVLVRMNRELGADFDPGAFSHAVRLRDDPFRVEAHLVARDATRARLGGAEFAFAPGDSIRTDTSHKYTPEAFAALASANGWTPLRYWAGPQGGFSLHLLRG
ncbi:dimethylhistidine N-methyltransferase [Methylobacterium sp. Leaf104]|uniref:L-histidine N(alpha)-methyltransferase n=1 Tax=Methylobacterium TaxID=407 RepID=UPI0006F8EFE0|nr:MULTISPECIES: L-histidine N(alpha)-methyltransferase [Methylobacterium]KQP31279.1 dimethylhistidine N-methyltransferase [Methylobacterium sp. Leaf104]MCI9881387.1 L-histidine N(alpha)-methyltransferase [Methylobacterium goesingense]